MKRTLIAATLFAAAAMLVAGGITRGTVPTALAAPTDQGNGELRAAAQEVADSARSVESDLALLESASSENPDAIQEYAVRVENGLNELTTKWSQFVSEAAAAGGAVDPNALVQYVLRESYMQTTEDLRFFAEKVKYFNEMKKWADAKNDKAFNVGVALLQRDVTDALSTAGFVSTMSEKPTPCP